jgi:aminoglycoside phosphotransferase family enzyme
MTTEQIHSLLLNKLPQGCNKPELVETHISWVIVCDSFVYKIKKPIQYSFLDFSTIEKRKYYCEREVELNRRFTNDIYLDVLPVKEWSNSFFIGKEEGEIVDYAVLMRKLDRAKQMDTLLKSNRVTYLDIEKLAEKVARFHQTATIIYEKDYLDVHEMFNDLRQECDYLEQHLGNNSCAIICHAIDVSNRFIEKHKERLAYRLANGLFRDCHGDLHSKNIFLLSIPQPFDCIEFNDDFRQIDVLNDVAFLCMDLDAFDRGDLSYLFFDNYNRLFPAATTKEDYQLFIYYKSYRANIRAKVNSLRARSADDNNSRNLALREANKYLYLMNNQIKALE